MEELKILINYFDKYPLITQKYADYQLFKQAFLLIDNKEHLTEEGLQKLVAIRASMNLGNSVALKAAFLPSSPAPPGRRGGRYNPSYKTFSGKSVNSRSQLNSWVYKRRRMFFCKIKRIILISNGL